MAAESGAAYWYRTKKFPDPLTFSLQRRRITQSALIVLVLMPWFLRRWARRLVKRRV